MNRRGFLTAMAAAPVAAVMAPAAKPVASALPYIDKFGSSLSCGVPATHVVEFGQSLYVGDMLLPTYWKHSEGWSMSGQLDDIVAIEDTDDGDELVEVEA